jgi:hypothetical protein
MLTSVQNRIAHNRLLFARGTGRERRKRTAVNADLEITEFINLIIIS